MDETSTTAAIAVRAAFPAFMAMPHVVQLIEEYLDYSVCFSLAQASAQGDVRLLERVGARMALFPVTDTGSGEAGRSQQELNALFSASLAQAAGCGHVDTVRWLVERFSCILKDENGEWDTTIAMVQAARFGHLPVMDCYPAATNGHFEIARWLATHMAAPMTVIVMYNAVRFGDLEMIKWLHSQNAYHCSPSVMDKAARLGHLEIVRWLHLHCNQGCTVNAMDWAARYGHLQVVKWLHENRSQGCTAAALDYAASNCHVSVVRWLLRHREEGDPDSVFRAAVQRGHADVAQAVGEYLGMTANEVAQELGEQGRQQ